MSTSEVTAPEQWTRQQRLSLFALCVALFANSFSMTVLFPFGAKRAHCRLHLCMPRGRVAKAPAMLSAVGFMVKHMGVTQDDTEVGFSAGYIAGAFMFGRIPGRCVPGPVSQALCPRPSLLPALPRGSRVHARRNT